jgi:Tol biopolymer transport system component
MILIMNFKRTIQRSKNSSINSKKHENTNTCLSFLHYILKKRWIDELNDVYFCHFFSFLFDIDLWRTTHNEIVTNIHEKIINIHQSFNECYIFTLYLWICSFVKRNFTFIASYEIFIIQDVIRVSIDIIVHVVIISFIEHHMHVFYHSRNVVKSVAIKKSEIAKDFLFSWA